MKTSRLVIKRVADGETHRIELRWNTSRARTGGTYGYPICNAFVDGNKVGSKMGGGYDLARDAMMPWLTTMVRPDDYGDWLRWADPTPPAYPFNASYADKRDEAHTLPEIRTGRTLASLLWCLGFEIVTDEHGQPGAGVEAARGDGRGR